MLFDSRKNVQTYKFRNYKGINFVYYPYTNYLFISGLKATERNFFNVCRIFVCYSNSQYRYKSPSICYK